MKKNIEFYQHYANADQHPKFKMLRVEFGWSGEGKFWALNNRIAQADGCLLDISKKYNKASLASDLDFKSNEFDKFIFCLLKDCELVREVEPGVITTDIVQENFQKVMLNREKARERKQRSLEKVKKGSGELPKNSCDQNNKVKESKVKESKGKKKTKAKNFIPPTEEEVIKYFYSKGYNLESAQKAFMYYESNNWHDSRGKKIKNWKQKMIGVWFKDENKINNNKKPLTRSERNAKACFDFCMEDENGQ